MRTRVTVDYQQIANDNIANQIYGFTIDYGKFILIVNYNITKAKRALCLANSASTICPWLYAADVLNN